MPYRAVFFDLDDTLYDDSASWHADAAGTATLAAETRPTLDAQALAQAYLDHSDTYWRALDPSRETRAILTIRTALWQEALQSVGHADAQLAEELAHEYGRRRSTGLVLFPDALPLLTALREAGKTLVLITNGLQSTHIERIALLGLEEYFDHTLISDAVGLAKPDPRIFRHALDLAGCAPHEAMMVGDNPVNDVAGALAVGIAACWFNPRALALPPNIPTPIGGEMRALSDLHSLLLPPPDSPVTGEVCSI